LILADNFQILGGDRTTLSTTNIVASHLQVGWLACMACWSGLFLFLSKSPAIQGKK
jgi:hypothetical protein